MLGGSKGEAAFESHYFDVVNVAPVPRGVSQICQPCFARQPREEVGYNSSSDAVNCAFWIFCFRAFKRKEVKWQKA